MMIPPEGRFAKFASVYRGDVILLYHSPPHFCRLCFLLKKRIPVARMAYKNYWMRNQSPENGSSIVPSHLQAEWEEVSKRLQEASEELNRIDSLYYEAMMARLALQEPIAPSPEWEALKEARYLAQKKHLAAITLRLNFTRKVNGES